MKGAAADLSFAAMRRHGPALASTSAEELIQVGNDLAAMRRALAADASRKLRDFQDRFAESPRGAASQGASNSTASAPPSADAAVKWAEAERLPEYDELRDLAANLISPTDTGVTQGGAGALPLAMPPSVIRDLPRMLEQRASRTASLVSAFKYQSQIQPVGQLHLERLEMVPVGIEHGELVHSVPLTPKETVNITHREWSVTTQTFENIVQDSFEGFSETGVTDKTDLSQATDNEAKHSSALDVSGSVSANYNGGAYSVSASSAVDYRQQTDTQQIEKDSIAHSLAITRNASTRTRKEHKISFRVSSVAGAEDLSVRVLTNPSDTDAMRVDYYQLLRKWRVDLIRYGLRMTYDLVIPNPGLDLIGRVLEIQVIDEMLTTTAYSFGLNITDISPDDDKWLDLSQQYGVELDPPPEPSIPIAYFKKLDPAKDGVVEGDVEIDITEGYELDKGTMQATLHLHVTSGDHHPQFGTFDGVHNATGYDLGVTSDLKPFRHTVGKLLISYGYLNSDDGSIVVSGSARVLKKTVQEWQLKSWTALRNADQAAYDHRIEEAKARKAYLQEQIGHFDALTLRKMEREEIMRWVLQWLIGPTFELMPKSLRDLFREYPTVIDLQLMFSVSDPSGIPAAGKNLVIVANVMTMLYFRVFDTDGKVVVDTNETSLGATKAGPILDLKAQLQSLGPPHVLTISEKERVIAAVASIVGYNLPPPKNLKEYAYPDVPDLTLDQWKSAISYGDFIKYIHEAVEWENVLFFAYPYFWDSAKNWPFKRFLVHPDPIHREFLRSGAMRVVLTIRPGFLTSFAMLISTGDSTAPPDTSYPYVTVAEDIRNFAMTNYEGIPPANPDKNVRPLLFPPQRKAWNDMQKLIQLLEDYNDGQHKRTLSSAIPSPGSHAATPSSMEGIEYGTLLTIDSGFNEEAVTVTATTANTLTANFTKSHAAGAEILIDPAVKLYPPTNQFPAALVQFAGNAPLPLTDPWGYPYHYASPGLYSDYDLVSFGSDGIPESDQTDPAQLADPLTEDITNYAEGSIVGRWYEYTPTGAMDVAINTVLPTKPQPA
jgi:hypothetical protein